MNEEVVLAAAIKYPAVLLYCNSIGMHYIFSNPNIKTIVSYVFTQYYKSKTLPSIERLKEVFPDIEKYNLSYLNMPDLVDYSIPIIQSMVESSIKKYDISGKEMKRILEKTYDISFLTYKDNGLFITDNIEERLDNYRTENEIFISTGIVALDNTIKGFTKNTLSIVLAKTNIGKSFILQHFAIVAAKQNYNVLFVSTEMDLRKIIKRMDAALTDTEMNKLKYKTPKELSKSLMKLKGKLYITQFPAAHLTVEELESYLEYINNSIFKVDVLVLDYADELSTGGMKDFDAANHIFSYLRGIATKYNIALITATQGNRETFESDTISISKVGRSYRGITIADLVIGLAQTDEEYISNVLRIFILKNRDSNKGQVVSVETQFSKGKIVG